MDQCFADVLAFHRKFGCLIGATPGEPDPGNYELRMKLLSEEYAELIAGILKGDLAKVADGAIDLIYVTVGTLIAYGIDPRPVWAAVQATNMAKEGGGVRWDGKILKPAGWVEPDIAGILDRQLPLDRD